MAHDALRSIDDVAVDIACEEHLFDDGAVDPFSERYEAVSGIKRIIEAAGARSDLGAGISTLTIRLPATELDMDSEPRIRAAIARYCRAQAGDIGRRIEVLRRQAYQTFGLGMTFAVVCLAVFLVLETTASGGSLVGRILQSSLVIAGWVALWRPIDLMLYEPWLLRREARVFEALAKVPVTVDTRA